MNWQVGDRAICITPGRWHLVECTITSELYPKIWNGPTIPAGTLVHETDLSSEIRGARIVGTPDEFIPIPDDDSRQVTTWDECPFKPLELVTL